MSNKVQNIGEIAPMGQQQGGGETADPVKADYLEGKGMLERGEAAMAMAPLHNALVGYEEKNDENGIANASNQLGIACFQKKEYAASLKHFERAEEICQKLGDPMSLVMLSKQTVLVYTELGQYKEAIDRCLDLLDLYQANNDPQGTVYMMEQMADIYLRSGDKKLAADSYRTIASIHKNFKHENIAQEFIGKAEELEKDV